MTSSTATTNTGAISLGIFAAIPVLYYLHKNYQEKKKKASDDVASSSSSSSLVKSSSNDMLNGYHIRPPFPPVIKKMLSSCRLAYLSTVDNSNSTSHLSLMRFTYINDPDYGEIVIMTTRRKTKKFDMLMKQKGVALLIHDFPQFDGGDGGGNNGIHSITLNGNCIIMDDDKKSEELRQVHLKHNAQYKQFIVGDEIAVLCVIVESARICNINDEVIKWNA